MTAAEIFRRVNEKLMCAGRPKVNSEKFMVVLATMIWEGKVLIENGQISLAKGTYQDIKELKNEGSALR